MTTTDATSPDFTEWLIRKPQPALHDLVQRYGGYHRVPWGQASRTRPPSAPNLLRTRGAWLAPSNR